MNVRQVFVAEGSAEIRHLIEADLRAAGFETIFFADRHALLASAMREVPACILIDRCQDAEMTLDILRHLQKEQCLAPVLVLYGESTIKSAVTAMKCGASDYIPRTTRGPDLIDCIVQAIEYNLTRVQARLSDLVLLQSPGSGHLSIREREILSHVLLGQTTKEIGQMLGLSPRTVEAHRASIRRKTGRRSWVELALAAAGDRARVA